MEHTPYERFAAWLTGQAAACKARQAALAADDRADEAIFAKIQANVYEIFHTVLGAGWKASGGDPAKARAFFAAKLTQIPQNWRDGLTASQAHGDMERAQVERLKLDALAQIELQFAQLWEE